MKKNYLISGTCGSGRSLIGNTIVNHSGLIDELTKNPFETSTSTEPFTKKASGYRQVGNDGIFVVDTAGYETKEEALEKLKEGLALVNYKVNCVVFVIKCNRIDEVTGEAIDYFSNTIFKDKIANNSVLVCMGGDNWLKKNTKNQSIQSLIKMCGGIERCFEFSFRFTELNFNSENQRQSEIDQFMKFLDQKDFKEIDLSYIQNINSSFSKELIKDKVWNLSELFPQYILLYSIILLCVFIMVFILQNHGSKIQISNEDLELIKEALQKTVENSVNEVTKKAVIDSVIPTIKSTITESVKEAVGTTVVNSLNEAVKLTVEKSIKEIMEDSVKKTVENGVRNVVKEVASNILKQNN